MSRSVKIYYGLSGSFKGTTIDQTLRPGDEVLHSGIKQWKFWEKNILSEKNNPNDLNFALLHLSRLMDREYSLIKDSTTFHVERGVTDMVFYWLLNHPTENYETIIKGLVEEEIRVSKFVGGDDIEPEKILLVQKDKEFIEKIVLREKTRSDRFPGGVEDYLKAQDLYVDFTKKYNKISKVIEVTSARDYLKKLGVKYNTE